MESGGARGAAATGGFDAAGLGVENDCGDLDAVGEGVDEAGEFLFEDELDPGADGGFQDESAVIDVAVFEEFFEVAADEWNDDAAGAVVRFAEEPEFAHADAVGVFLGDVFLIDHAIEDFVALLEGTFQISEGRAGVGSADDAGEEGALVRGEFGRGDAEVGAGCFVESMAAGAEVDAVEVAGEDFVFGVVGFDAESDGDFEQLSVEAALVHAVAVSGELHGERGGALGEGSVAEVALSGAEESHHIDAVVFEEAFVFAGLEGLDEEGRNFLTSEESSVFAVEGGDFAVLDVEDDGAFGHGGDFLEVVAEGEAGIEEGDGETEEGEEDAGLQGETQWAAEGAWDPVGDTGGPFRRAPRIGVRSILKSALLAGPAGWGVAGQGERSYR